MRIIAGQLKSRLFQAAAAGQSHPMSERAKIALFNRLGDLSDLVVLDAFSGSGSLAFESLSRGAKRAVCLEINRRVYKTLLQNCQKLGLASKIDCYQRNTASYIKSHSEQFLPFDIIFADPPYQDFKEAIVAQLAAQTRPGARLIISWPDHWRPKTGLYLPDWDELNKSRYARANIGIFLKKRKPQADRFNVSEFLKQQNKLT